MLTAICEETEQLPEFLGFEKKMSAAGKFGKMEIDQ